MLTALDARHRIPGATPGFSPRLRLIDLLDSGADRDLVVVAAPAGYGKTTLVAAWLRQRIGGSHAWYALEASDNSPEVFLARLIDALQTIHPACGTQARGILQYYEQPAFALAAERLLQECAALPQGTVLVLEDYHLITAAAIHEFVQALVRQVSACLQLIIITRFDPPFRLPRLKAQGRLLDIRAHDLRFSVEEVRAYFAVTFGEAVPEEIVQALAQRTEGWAAGLQLSAIALRHAEDATAFMQRLERHADRYVIDYLVDEVLEEQAPQVRSFLVTTSLLARLNVPLAAQITGLGEQQCAQILDHLRRTNLFLISLDDSDYWYRYHHQFQVMLQSRLRLQCTAAEIIDLSGRAAAWLEDAGYWDEALEQYVGAKEWEAAGNLIERRGYELLDQLEWQRLERWLALLPPAVGQRRPVLLLLHAWNCVPLLKPLAHRRLLVEQAEALLRSLADDTRLPFLQAQVDGLHSLHHPDIPLAERKAAAKRALAGLGMRCGWISATVTYHAALLLCEEGKLQDAVQLTADTIRAWPPQSLTGYTLLHHSLLTLYYWRGTLEELEQTVYDLRQRFRPEQAPSWRAILRNYMAVVHAERGEFEAAEHLLLQVLDPREAVTLGTRTRALVKYAQIAAFTGRTAPLARAVAPYSSLAGADYGEEQPEVLKASTALAALVCGDRAPALRWAQAETGPVRASALAVAQLPLVRAEILLAGNSEDVQTAVSLLTSHLAYVHNLQLAGEAVQTAILLARACWQAQRQADALRALDEAVTIGYARGYRWSFHRHGTVMQEMLQALRHRFCDVGAIDALLHAFPPAAETPAAAEAPATPLVRPSVMLYVDLLTTRELQVLRLLAQDLTNKEIAKVLSVSTFTVRNHTVNIYQKLEVASRRQAILRAAELGLLQEAGSTAA